MLQSIWLPVGLPVPQYQDWKPATSGLLFTLRAQLLIDGKLQVTNAQFSLNGAQRSSHLTIIDFMLG